MKPTTVQCTLLAMESDSDAPSCMWAVVVHLPLLPHNTRCMIFCWVLLEKKQVSNVLYFMLLQASTTILIIEYKYQKYFLQYVVMKVPPMAYLVSVKWHCSKALGWVKFLSDNTVCEELIVFDRLSSMGLWFSVQKTLPWAREVWHTISTLDPASMYTSLGKTLPVVLFWPAGNEDVN